MSSNPKPMITELVIPYFDKDPGVRPNKLHPEIVYFLCPSIKINGHRYVGELLRSTRSITITVDVTNMGTKDAHAQLRLYWGDPSVGFSPLTLKGKEITRDPILLNVVPSTTSISPDIPWTLPSGIPNHICIVAVVESYDDPPDGSWDPSLDRHYGQLNITLIHLDLDIDLLQRVVFFVSNPYPDDVISTIHVRGLSEEQLLQLESLYNARSIQPKLDSFQFQIIENTQDKLVSSELRLELGPYERRCCQVIIPYIHGLEDLTFAAVEIEEILIPLSNNKEISMKESYGALGIVIFGSSKHR